MEPGAQAQPINGTDQSGYLTHVWLVSGLGLVRWVELGGDLFAQQDSESGPRGIRTHTIDARLWKKRHANR